MRSAVNVTKLILLTSCLSLSACDSDGDGRETLRVKDPSGGTSKVPQLAIGTGHGDQFQAGALRLSTPTLAAGGEATVSADIVDRAADNAPFNQSIPVTFTSNCVAQSTATMTSPVSTGPTGTAQTIYKANGCEGVDTITASINNGSSIASVNITVASADAGSLTSV